MTGTFMDLGVVTAPSGLLALAMASWLDYWPELGQPLSHRAAAAAATGDGHIHEWLCEAIAVPAADDQPLAVQASTTRSPFDGRPAIATLQVGLGLPWPSAAAGAAPVSIGDLPVDLCGMLIGDARGLDGFTAVNSASTGGLADVTYWGRHRDAAHAQFGGATISRHGAGTRRGWLTLSRAPAPT